MNLTLKDIGINKSSYVDPNGFLFEYKKDLYRAIKRKDFYNEMFEKGVFKELEKEYNLIGTTKTSHRIESLGCDLVFGHPRVTPLSYCVEWCPSMLKDAALVTLKLNLKLLDYDCYLQDAYPWNVLFDGNMPYFVDLTSIVPIEGNLLWPAYQQFINFFLNPLKLAADGKGDIARFYLHDYINGLAAEDLYKTLSATYRASHPFEMLMFKMSKVVTNLLQKNVNMKASFQSKIKNIKTSNEIRKRFFSKLLKQVEAIRVIPKRTSWKSYYAEINREFDQNNKVAEVKRIIAGIKPASVLDLGCNTGRFSLLAAETGAKVISVDSSEDSVEFLYHELKEKNMVNVHPLIMDVVNMTPPFGFMSRQFPSFIERCKSDLVLFLGIMHHVHINARQSFERIAELLDSLVNKALIFEYVDTTDDNINLLDHGRDISYSPESLKKVLGNYFKIQTFPSDRPTRQLFLCTKK